MDEVEISDKLFENYTKVMNVMVPAPDIKDVLKTKFPYFDYRTVWIGPREIINFYENFIRIVFECPQCRANGRGDSNVIVIKVTEKAVYNCDGWLMPLLPVICWQCYRIENNEGFFPNEIAIKILNAARALGWEL